MALTIARHCVHHTLNGAWQRTLQLISLAHVPHLMCGALSILCLANEKHQVIKETDVIPLVGAVLAEHSQNEQTKQQAQRLMKLLLE